MSSDSLSLVGNWPMRNNTVSNRDGFKAPPRTPNLRLSQGTTTAEFIEYLKRYEPETYRALQYFADKYPARQLTEEEREKLNNTTLKAFRPPSPKTCSQIWKTIKSWFTKVKPDDIQDGYDKMVAIQDAVDKINHVNTNINIKSFG